MPLFCSLYTNCMWNKKELNNSVSLAKIMELLIYDIPELLIPAIGFLIVGVIMLKR